MNQHVHRGRRTQPRSGNERILPVIGRRILIRYNRRDSPLSIPGIAVQQRFFFVTINTLCFSDAFRAVKRPAIPAPITMTSV